ncbi:MAG: DUF2721 domain-containing protein [Hyphomonas sp.]
MPPATGRRPIRTCPPPSRSAPGPAPSGTIRNKCTGRATNQQAWSKREGSHSADTRPCLTSFIPEDIAHVIQIAIAPVFLLAGIGAFLSVMANRLARIVDRWRALRRNLATCDADARKLHIEELVGLDRRMVNTSRAIALSTLAALLVCVVIILLFTGQLLHVPVTQAVSILFIAAMSVLCRRTDLFPSGNPDCQPHPAGRPRAAEARTRTVTQAFQLSRNSASVMPSWPSSSALAGHRQQVGQCLPTKPRIDEGHHGAADAIAVLAAPARFQFGRRRTGGDRSGRIACMAAFQLAGDIGRKPFDEPTHLVHAGKVPGRIVLPVIGMHQLMGDQRPHFFRVAAIMFAGFPGPGGRRENRKPVGDTHAYHPALGRCHAPVGRHHRIEGGAVPGDRHAHGLSERVSEEGFNLRLRCGGIVMRFGKAGIVRRSSDVEGRCGRRRRRSRTGRQQAGDRQQDVAWDHELSSGQGARGLPRRMPPETPLDADRPIFFRGPYMPRNSGRWNG